MRRLSKKDYRLQFQDIDQTPGEYGEFDEEDADRWTTQFSKWGELAQTSGYELLSADRDNATERAAFHVRYDSRITTRMRILDQLGRWWRINSVVSPEEPHRRREMMIVCSIVDAR
jgi:SPP1 family predicted phage head-tail adaptor